MLMLPRAGGLLLLVVTFTYSCGQENPFARNNKSKPNRPETDLESVNPPAKATEESLDATPPEKPLENEPQTDETNPEISAIQMQVDCVSTPAEVPNNLTTTLYGKSDEILLRRWTSAATLPINVSGKICDAVNIKRNIVIMVDVSGSMAANDPIVGNTCGRLQAVEALIARSGPQKSYALVTFSDSVMDSSRGFFKTSQELFNDISPELSPKDILCFALDTTFYDLALDRARDLFAGAPEAEFSELYIISDGAPSAAHEGFEVAAEIRAGGTSIGAIMLNGIDQVLEKKIVSQGPDGRPLFFKVADADALTKTLADLAAAAENRVIEASFTFRGLASGRVDSVDLQPLIQGDEFHLASYLLRPDDDDVGLELTYFYRLSSGERHSLSSQILWLP